jgi:hypothetical protein
MPLLLCYAGYASSSAVGTKELSDASHAATNMRRFLESAEASHLAYTKTAAPQQ